MKKVILGIVVVLVVLVGGIGSYLAYDSHQKAIEQQKADKQYQTDFQNNGVDTSSDKTTTTSASTDSGMSIDEVESILKQQIGKDFTPDQAQTLISGYTMNKMGNHQYAFRESSSKDYLVVTFNADETSVVSVVKD